MSWPASVLRGLNSCYSSGMSEDTKPQYNVNDEVTLNRGKQRGTTGTVIAVDHSKREYAVQTAEGLKVVSFAGVKAKQEKTLTASEFAEMEADHEDSDALLAEVRRHLHS